MSAGGSDRQEHRAEASVPFEKYAKLEGAPMPDIFLVGSGSTAGSHQRGAAFVFDKDVGASTGMVVQS